MLCQTQLGNQGGAESGRPGRLGPDDFSLPALRGARPGG